MEMMQRNDEFEDDDSSAVLRSSTRPQEADRREYSLLEDTQQMISDSHSTQEKEVKNTNETMEDDLIFKKLKNYNQIGVDVKFNLELLETRQQSLDKILSQEVHECYLLRKQKESQMKSLVDLQIRLEKLDMERVSILKECQKDKSEKTEVFTYEMQSILENDDFISNTYTKFSEILKLEQQEIQNFIVEVKTELMSQKLQGEEFNQKLNEIRSPFKNQYDSLLVKDADLVEDLRRGLTELSSIRETVMKIIEERTLAQKEHREIFENHRQLNSSLELKKSIFTESENNLKNMQTHYEESLLAKNHVIEKIKEEIDKILLECQEVHESLSEKQIAQDSLRQISEDSLDKFSKAEQELVSIEEEQHELHSQYQLLASHLKDAKSVEVSLDEKEVQLTSLSARLLELQKEESTFQDVISSLIPEVLHSEKSLQDTKNNEDSLTEEERQLLEDHGESQQKLIELEEKLKELSLLSVQHCERVGHELSEKFLEYDSIKSSITEIEREEYDIGLFMKETENKLADSQLENKTLLDMREELYEEINKMELLSGEVQDLNIQYENSLLERANLDSELMEITTSLEEAPDVCSLEAELNQIKSEIEEVTVIKNEEIATIEMSFQSQTKNWENKISREMKEIEILIAKGVARAKKMSEAVPQLNTNISILEGDLENSIPSIVKEIQKALTIVEEMANYYFKYKNVKNLESNYHLVRNLTSIDEQFVRPMKCMMSLDGIPKINLDNPPSDAYRTVVNAFKKKFKSICEEPDNNPPLEMAKKLREMGNSIFGEKWVETVYSQSFCENEISSSTSEIQF